MPSRRLLSALASGLFLLATGCKEEEPLPPPAVKPTVPAKATGSNEPPPFTAADSSPTKASVEEGTAQAPQFTPPSGAPTTRSKPAPAAEPREKAAKAAAIPQSTPATATVVPSAQGEWVLQVGIHKTEDAARKMADKLKAKGFPAYVLNVATGGTGLSGSYYRVRIGAFATRDDALRYGENVLKPSGIKDFWADKKSNEAKAREAQLPTP